MDILRRHNLETQTQAEKAIGKAIEEVENIGAHTELTETVVILLKAKEVLSDYIDKTEFNIKLRKDLK